MELELELESVDGIGTEIEVRPRIGTYIGELEVSRRYAVEVLD